MILISEFLFFKIFFKNIISSAVLTKERAIKFTLFLIPNKTSFLFFSVKELILRLVFGKLTLFLFFSSLPIITLQ